LPGVLRAEPFRAIPVRLRAGPRQERTELVGLPADGELRNLVGRRGRPLPLPADGLVLTRRLARQLAVSPGEQVAVEMLDGARRTFELPLAAVSDEPLGMSAWMELAALGRTLREEAVISGALLRIDALRRAATWASLRRLPGVSGITVRAAVIDGIQQALDRSFSVMTAVFTAFSCVLVVGIVYNSARIALSERGSELASLRVLGFSRREVAILLLGEQALLTALALPLGCALGYLLAALLVPVFDRDLFRLPLVLQPGTFAWATAIVVAAAALSGGLVGRDIARLDLVAVLKSRA
jgi:putative ABC transport system permease protein